MAARGKKLIKARRRAEFKHKNFRIRRDDTVQVIAGEDRGRIGKVLQVIPARERVVVEGLNKMFKHMRRTQQNPQGGRIEREAPIHISNVALLCPSCNVGSRVKMRTDGDQKVRVCARCDANLDG